MSSVLFMSRQACSRRIICWYPSAMSSALSVLAHRSASEAAYEMRK